MAANYMMPTGGIAGYGARLRAGETTAAAATAAYLARIAALDRRLGAYEHVDGARARAIDTQVVGRTPQQCASLREVRVATLTLRPPMNLQPAPRTAPHCERNGLQH
jgi:Asp-tRNA(Asn)/Glu-tRNA(Gln) amidotransferase A subunit family amidase